jgi:hypothetical protein
MLAILAYLFFTAVAVLGIGVVIFIFSGLLSPRLPLEGEGQEFVEPEEFNGFQSYTATI